MQYIFFNIKDDERFKNLLKSLEKSSRLEKVCRKDLVMVQNLKFKVTFERNARISHRFDPTSCRN